MKIINLCKITLPTYGTDNPILYVRVVPEPLDMVEHPAFRDLGDISMALIIRYDSRNDIMKAYRMLPEKTTIMKYAMNRRLNAKTMSVINATSHQSESGMVFASDLSLRLIFYDIYRDLQDISEFLASSLYVLFKRDLVSMLSH